MNYILITLTIQIIYSNEQLDIMVKPEQRIEEVLKILIENGQLLSLIRLTTLSIRSWRLNTYINQHLTFKQGEIMTGDILYIEGDITDETIH